MTVEATSRDAAQGDHVVQFYAHDAELTEAVGQYLVQAVTANEMAIVIATEAHRHAFDAELAAAGIDAARARAHGRLVSLDAEATLAAFRTGGEIDRAAFHEVVGGLVRRVAGSGRPVRAYGEMVALLWDAGDVAGAIELETLWNELGRELPFSLYCAYPAASVSGSEHADALHEVCHLHTSVVSQGVELSADYPADFHAPASARRDVVRALRKAGHRGTVADDAQLVVGELTANAVRHAGSQFSVALRLRGSVLRVEVSDELPPPAVTGGGLVAHPPHGLALVDALAKRWGVDSTTRGKVVWAELSV